MTPRPPQDRSHMTAKAASESTMERQLPGSVAGVRQMLYVASLYLSSYSAMWPLILGSQAWKWAIRKEMWDYMEENDIARCEGLAPIG